MEIISNCSNKYRSSMRKYKCRVRRLKILGWVSILDTDLREDLSEMGTFEKRPE
jgi:hypothetical protein